MASEIRVNKINSRTGVGTITLSPTGVDFTGIATVATLKATTGIVTTLTVTGTTTLNGNLDLQDDDKILIGTGDDLEIYHDGSHSYIDDSGTGDLRIRSNNVRFDKYTGETIAQFIGDGRVELYYDNSKKLETSSDGVTITGTATATEGLVLDGQTGSGKGLRLDLAGSGDYVIQETTTDDVVQFGGTGASNFFVHNISSGIISIGTTTGTGNLNVAGTGDCALDLIADVDNNGSNQWPLINFRRNSATGTPAARIYHQESSGALTFDNGGSERLRIQSAGGISFNGDTAQANALEDYEEGTYLPTVTLGSGSATLNTSYDRLAYTKIGRVVHIQGQIVFSAVSSPSGTIAISLPFNTPSLVDRADFAHQTCIAYWNGSGVSNGLYITRVLMDDNSSSALLRPIIGFGSEESSPGDYIGGGTDIWFNVTYIAA